MEKLTKLITLGVREGLSDLHITGGHPVVFRKNGVISFERSLRWTHQEIDTLVKKLLNPKQLQMLKMRWSVDLAMSIAHVRVRMNVFNTTRGLSMAIRLLPGSVPNINSLNLHPSLQQIATNTKSGLVLICGPTGCGKSTTIAAMVNEINQTKPAHIVTLEDPIEFRFLSKQSFVEQRELGTHMLSFEQGLLDVLREAPDVIVVGELREPETMRLTLNAAESGHLVIASVHASNSEDALYRICNSFSPEGQEVVRTQLASTLAWVIVQQLVYLEKPGFRVPLLSMLRGVSAAKGVIRDNRLSQIESILQTGRGEGMFTMDAYFKEYLSKRQSFTPPSENFKPSPEVSSEVVYQSPLIDPQAVPRSFSTRGGRRATDKIPPITYAMPGDAHEDAHHEENAKDLYLIQEEAKVDELIEQITKSGRFRKE